MFKSGYDLFESVQKFILVNDEITIFSPYIKLNQIELLNKEKKIKRIIVRWEIRDLCLGVSDLELFQYCKSNRISLFRNTRIHLKVIWNNNSDLILGSANVTNKGLGEIGNYNYELNGLIQNIDFDDHSYLNKIIFESEYLTESLFEEIQNLVESTILPSVNFPILDTCKKEIDYFLISQLPMSESPRTFYDKYLARENLKGDDLIYLVHDLVLFELDSNYDESEFFSRLKSKFNLHPFVLSFKSFVKKQSRKSINYGGCVSWFQENTTTVPTPHSWELKKDKIINNLYEWICFFDDEFNWSIPGNRSQVLFYNSN